MRTKGFDLLSTLGAFPPFQIHFPRLRVALTKQNKNKNLPWFFAEMTKSKERKMTKRKDRRTTKRKDRKMTKKKDRKTTKRKDRKTTKSKDRKMTKRKDLNRGMANRCSIKNQTMARLAARRHFPL